MPDKLNQFFDGLNDKGNPSVDQIKDRAQSGINRTGGESGKSPKSLGAGIKPGFTPNSEYNFNDNPDVEANWEGNLINSEGLTPVDTNGRFNLNDGWTEESGPLPTRNFYQIFNDQSTDFFRHGLHIDGRTPLKVSKDSEHTTDGSEANPQSPYRLDNFFETPYENNDPVMFGFEIVIHGDTSPLFNGSVEDFINQFGYLKEVGSRADIIANFKRQFFKFFKSDTPITSTGTEIKSDRFYLSYYLKKVSGLENLVESNTSDKAKAFVDYRKDVIKLTFAEDVSLSIGSLAHLYKLLYWSKINGKNIIPQNLLRFDCDIIVTEVRNFKRVRKAIKGGNGVEVLSDNLSRYVYSLYECQMFFDKMAHDSEINLGDAPKVFDAYEMSFNYKFSSLRFEKWVPKFTSVDTANGKPDPKYTGGGQYVSLINDRMDPYAVKTSETNNVSATGSSISTTPAQPTPVMLESFRLSDQSQTAGQDSQNPEVVDDVDNSGNEMSTLDRFKESSKKAAKNLAKTAKKAAINRINTAINIRARLLNNSIDKIRNSMGIGRMSAPTNVYKPPGGASNPNSRFFYDIQNGLRDFLGETLGGTLGGG